MKITNSNRVMICGTTGAGKSVLAKYLLSMCNRVIVIDPKHEFTLEGVKVNKSMTWPNVWKKDFSMIIRPRRNDDEKLAEFLIQAFKRRNVYIYIDELAVMEKRFPLSTEVLEEIALTGRSKHISLWNATQRPRGIPKLFFTESEVFFIFRLQDADDRDHVAGYIGEEVREKIPHYVFWYYRGEEDAPRLMSLNLETNKIYPIDNLEESED